MISIQLSLLKLMFPMELLGFAYSNGIESSTLDKQENMCSNICVYFQFGKIFRFQDFPYLSFFQNC